MGSIASKQNRLKSFFWMIATSGYSDERERERERGEERCVFQSFTNLA
jgi:hypothetical protein